MDSIRKPIISTGAMTGPMTKFNMTKFKLCILHILLRIIQKQLNNATTNQSQKKHFDKQTATVLSRLLSGRSSEAMNNDSLTKEAEKLVNIGIPVIPRAIVINPDGTIPLLRRADGKFAGYLEFPGGTRRDGDNNNPTETIEECIIRECQEELGYPMPENGMQLCPLTTACMITQAGPGSYNLKFFPLYCILNLPHGNTYELSNNPDQLSSEHDNIYIRSPTDFFGDSHQETIIPPDIADKLTPISTILLQILRPSAPHIYNALNLASLNLKKQQPH